jgi:predicted O-linked N-acetylglucosamine transferase (SPINDLY family)
MKVGRGEQGMECIRKAVALQPGNPELESLLVMMVQYREPGEVIHREASAWGRRHADPLGASADPFGKHSRDPERRLKLGLLGRELREDLLRALLTGSGGDGGRSAFHITVYCDSARREWRNHPLRQMVDRWETIAGRSDEAVAALIRGQEIDILLNLQGHGAAGGVGNGGVRSGVNRLLVVARRPAPVQVQYLANVGQGNRGSMGIAALAYRITDWVADPEGVEGAYRETLWRLPGCAWCFAAPAGAPEVGPVPSLDAEGVSRVRFGVFHSIARISPEAAEAWGRILEEVPGSRLLIKAPELGDAATWRQVESVLKESGIDVKRVELQGWMEDRGAHLSLYGEVDVALDVFPYHGTSSTFEALWMGVPVVTLGENGKAGGTGASLLTHAELGELVAGTVEEYVSIAVNLVRDRDRLRGYRATLRERLRGSPLMDGAGHARQMQEALRGMWAKFCVLSSEF